MALIQNLKNKLGEIIYPITKANAVYTEDGTTVEDKISTLNGSLKRTLLWENSNHTNAFSAQTITLLSSDYDELQVWFKVQKASTDVICKKILKGYQTWLEIALTSGAGTSCRVRNMVRISNTQYEFKDTYFCQTGSDIAEVNNDLVIPLYIYGVKYLDNDQII